MPATGVAMSPPVIERADGDARWPARTTMTTTIADEHAEPAARRPSAPRDSGVASRNSSRPGRLVRRPAGDERRRGEPGQDEPELDEQRAAGTRRPARCRCSGRRVARSSHEVRRLVELVDERARPSRRSAARTGRCPRPHARADGRRVAERPAGRAAQARRAARGRLGVGIALVAPRSRRTNASTPMTSRTTATTATRPTDGPVELAGQREVVRGPAEPGQVRRTARAPGWRRGSR